METERDFECRNGQLLSHFISHTYEILKNKKSIPKERMRRKWLAHIHSEDSGKGVSRSL